MIKGIVVFYLLVLVRILGFFSSTPLFSQKKVPRIWKLSASLVLVVIMSPLLTPRVMPVNVLWLLAAVLWELIVGVTLGLILTSAVGAVLSAGSLIDTQMGFANAGILNPGSDQAEPLVASFLKTLFLMACVLSSAHLILLRLLLESFNWFPTGLILHKFANLTEFGLALVSQFFVSVLWLVLPICLALLTVEVCIAFLSRMIPQMNMLIAAAPFRVLAGFGFVMIALPTLLQTMSEILTVHLNLVEVLRV